MKKLEFKEMELSAPVMRAIEEMGFAQATPIQAEAIPALILGRDLIGHAQTGTGKTAAFAIPIIERLDIDRKDIQALVLCPTRELVMQVTEEFRRILKYKYNIGVVPVYGGQEIDRQILALKKRPHIIVGTPGRLMDHMRRATIKFDAVRTVVLDEADEMLDMGFREDMEVILGATPDARQTIMFSATMPEDIIRLMKRYQKDPVKVDVTRQKLSAPKIEQSYFEIPESTKTEALARLIDYHGISLALVFCNTRARVDRLVEELKARGYAAEGLHGEMSQNQRTRIMSGFRAGAVGVLVATDVAGRGIDVNDIGAVFNFDLPRDDEDYVHRIGRTGRAGKTGRAFTFIVGRQIFDLRRIESAYGIRVERRLIPTLDELDATRVGKYREKIEAELKKGRLGKYATLVENIIGEEYTPLDAAAALLKICLDGRADTFEKINIEKPRRSLAFSPDGPDAAGGEGSRGDDIFTDGTAEEGEGRDTRKRFGARTGGRGRDDTKRQDGRLPKDVTFGGHEKSRYAKDRSDRFRKSGPGDKKAGSFERPAPREDMRKKDSGDGNNSRGARPAETPGKAAGKKGAHFDKFNKKNKKWR